MQNLNLKFILKIVIDDNWFDQVLTGEEQVCFADCESTQDLSFINRSTKRQDRICIFRSTWLCHSEIFEIVRLNSNTKQCSWWLLLNLFTLHIKVVRLKMFEEIRLIKKFDKYPLIIQNLNRYIIYLLVVWKIVNDNNQVISLVYSPRWYNMIRWFPWRRILNRR